MRGNIIFLKFIAYMNFRYINLNSLYFMAFYASIDFFGEIWYNQPQYTDLQGDLFEGH